MFDHSIHPRQRLFAAALQLFAARGYRGTGVQDVVELAGVTKPTLYYYFENKAGLYRELVETAFNTRLERMQSAAARHYTTQDKLIAVMQALLDFSRENGELMRLAYANVFGAPEEVPDSVRGCQKAQGNFEFVQGLVKEGIENGEISGRYDSLDLTTAIYGHFYMADSIMTLRPDQWHPDRGEKLVRLFFEGAEQRAMSSKRPPLQPI